MRVLTKYELSKKATDSVLELIEPIVEDHRQTLDPNNARDFLDVMLLESESNLDPQSPFEEKLAPATITNTIIDLVLGGMETTSSSLLHIFLQMVLFLDVQDKVHEELDAVNKLFFKNLKLIQVCKGALLCTCKLGVDVS